MALDSPTWNMGHLCSPDIQEYLKHKDIVRKKDDEASRRFGEHLGRALKALENEKTT